ncbi:hypothetical protein LCGC14_0424720 [marine sediment metagenome]|uniref:Uncharacterized protein n=1 Tax=marine sediment metagenome TaxID=412755 RepID=A0A0F9SPU2_9ZZZZ
MSDQEKLGDKCPTCGRFISLGGNGEFYDVEPGGCRGSEPVSAYCSEQCAEKMFRRTQHGDGVEACMCCG